MPKVMLEIEEENLDTVLTILKSIKSELISNISVDESTLSKKPFKYIPKNGIKKRVSNVQKPIKGAISLKNDYKANIQSKLS
ncbi:hypothetical protein [Arcobacter sp.]|uniref:hypothetical protein n=1 Tax=Arcobacter sp. TaxID=1872629 RepID=UPI003D14EAD2